MSVSEIEAKSILRKQKKIDSWFISRYGMNLYRGCTYNCVYCDGRAEAYYVDGEYRLTRKALHVISESNFPVFVLTKSTLVERDVDILKAINAKTRAIVCFSFSSFDEKTSAIFEPGVPSPAERLETLALFKREGIACGMFLMPAIPFVTDTPLMMEQIIRKAHETGLDFIIFGGMTLKEGRQKQYFLNALTKHYPALAPNYHRIYRGNRWGQAIDAYYDNLHRIFYPLAKKYKIPVRIPNALFRDFLSENDLVTVILEHIDYLLKLNGVKSPYGYAAYSISQLKEPLSAMSGGFNQIKGVGKTTERLICEIIETGRSSYYEKLATES